MSSITLNDSSGYPIVLSYTNGANFLITPLPNYVEFPNNEKATLAKVSTSREELSAVPDTLPPELESYEYAPGKYGVRQVNQYGADNLVTCKWAEDTDSDFSEFLPTFKTNDAVIRVSEFGDLTVVNVSADYDRTYQAIGTRGVILPDGSFSEDNEYLWYAAEDVNYFYCVAFKQGSWRAFRTTVDPKTLQDGDLTGNQVISTVNNATEVIDGLRRAAPGPKNSYAPNGGGYANFDNGITSFSDDFFVGKNELFFEMDFITLPNSEGVNNLFYIGFSETKKNLRLQKNGKYLRLNIRTDNGITEILQFTLPDSGAGHSYKVGVDFKNFDDDSQTPGALYLYVDGVLVDSLVLNSVLSTATWKNMIFLQQNFVAFKNFRFQDKLKYNGANYTPETVLSAEAFAGAKFNFIAAAYEGVGNVTGVTSLEVTGAAGTRYTLDSHYYDTVSGQWTGSTSLAQSNNINTFNDNLATFPLTNYLVANIIMQKSDERASIESAKLTYEAEKYPSTAMIAPIFAYNRVKKIKSIEPSVDLPTVNVDITYAISINGVLKWWNNGWVLSTGAKVQTNTLADFNAHIGDLPIDGSWRVHVFPSSYDNPDKGYQDALGPSIFNMVVNTEILVNPVAPPDPCVVYFFSLTPCFKKSFDSIVIKNERLFMHGEYKIDAYECVITPENIAGLGSGPIVESETINANATSVSEKYLYSMWIRKVIPESVDPLTARIIPESKIDTLLGYVEIPNSGQVTLDELWDARIFEVPANGTATEAELSKALSDYPIPV